MTRPRKRKNAGGLTGFTVVDPGGNWIRFSVRESKDLDEHEAWKQSPASASKLAAALQNAVVIGPASASWSRPWGCSWTPPSGNG